MRKPWPGFARETHRFMRGHCCDLAFALSELEPGAAIVGIGGSPRFTDHAALRLSDGLYLDARGLSDEAGFRDGLGADGAIFPMTRDDLLGQMGLAGMDRPLSPDLAKARSAARAIRSWVKDLGPAYPTPASDADEAPPPAP